MKVLLILLIVSLANGDKVVNTRNGPVRGVSLSPKKKVEAFLGIPYAEPPVGPLRFENPVPKSSWEEIYDANKMPPTCMQFSVGDHYFSPDHKMSEDCLHLNLWVPEGGSDSKPILLWIHGGGFQLGSSNTKVYDGANLAEHGDVIVASINYRLGTLGFFYSFTEKAPGNMAMYDQVMAMQWIKDNAENFGGDPDNIVLFGESAGAFSISYHMVSPLSRNLFNRAILQSGSAFNPVFSNDNRRLLEISKSIAIHFGCAEKSDSFEKKPKNIIDCMKSLPPEKYPEADIYVSKKYKYIFPGVDDSFLTESAMDSFNKGNFKDSDLLIGVNRDEGPDLLAFSMADVLGVYGEKAENLDLNEAWARQSLEKVLDFIEINNTIIESYFNRVKEDPNYTYLLAISDIMGDLIISCGAVFQAEYHSLKGNPVYFYRFEYRPDSTPLAEWMGVTHFDEVQYVFGNPVHKEFTETEKELSSDIMDMWVAFAKTGNPSIPHGMKWPLFTYRDPKYMALSKEDKIAVRPDNDRCEVWRSVFQSNIDEDIIQRLKKA